MVKLILPVLTLIITLPDISSNTARLERKTWSVDSNAGTEINSKCLEENHHLETYYRSETVDDNVSIIESVKVMISK